MELKAVGINAKDRKDRLDWYSHKIEKNSNGGITKVQPLHLKATNKYLIVSDQSLYECYQLEIVGFNKLLDEWEYDPNTYTLRRMAIEQSYRDFSECRDGATFPISLTVNGVDGISHGLYCVVAKDLEHDTVVNMLLWIDNGKSRLVDIRNKCAFSVYKLKP